MLKSNFTKLAILKKLMESSNKVISSAVLLNDMEISRQSIWKNMESLREEGLDIESTPHKGYTLHGQSNDLAPTWIAANVEGHCSWGKNIYFFDTLDSTQKTAKELARKHCVNGTTVISEKQTSGRGRVDRQWFSPSGKNLYMSVVSFPKLNPSMLQMVNIAAGLAVVSALDEICGLTCSLKWPNDVIYQDRKLCGILSEASIESDCIHFVVTGIGININIDAGSFPPGVKAVSIMDLVKHKTDRGILAGRIISNFHSQLKDLEIDGQDPILERYGNICTTIGREIEIVTDDRTYTGKAAGVTRQGEIVVMTQKGRMTFSAADVIHAPNK